MKLRIQAEGKKTVVEVPDTEQTLLLLRKIEEIAGTHDFLIKRGFPPKPVDYDPHSPISSSFRTGDSLLIERKGAVTEQATSAASIKPKIEDAPLVRQREVLQAPPNPVIDDMAPPEVIVPGRGVLVLRVQPDDNSCLFRAVGYLCMRSIDSMQELRSLISTTIQENPVDYNDAVLGMKRDLYAAKMNRADTWGGEIEMKILSDHFQVQIASIDCKSGHIYRYGESYAQCIYLCYSGIHYDALALSPTENAPPDWDVTQFDSDDRVLESAASELVSRLRKKNYFTDTANFDLRCQDCGTGLKGEKGAQAHAKQTGHVNFGEYGSVA